MGIINGVILIGVGLLMCFFGVRLYRIMLALAGFVTGYVLVSGLLASQGPPVQIIGAIIAGVILAFIFWSLYKLAYILFGVFLGLAVASLIGGAFNITGLVYLIVAVVLALIGGALGSAVGEVMLRLSTAFGGATQAVGGVAALTATMGLALPLVDPTAQAVSANTTAGLVTLAAVFVLGLIGFFFQMGQRAEI